MKSSQTTLALLCIVLAVLFFSCDYSKKDYDVIYEKDGYVLLKSKKSDKEARAFASKEIDPKAAADHVKHYDTIKKTQLFHPSFSDFSYSDIFDLLQNLKTEVGESFDAKKAGVRLYFAAYETNPIREGVELKFKDWMTNIVVGTYEDVDRSKYYNLSDLCPPNCWGKLDVTLKPDPKKSKLIQ